MDQARAWQERLEAGDVASQTALAEELGVSQPWVNQRLRLLSLAPMILEELEELTAEGPVPSEKKLLKLARVTSESVQLQRFQELCALELRRLPLGRVRPAPGVRRQGLQHLFAEARRWQAALERGEARSLQALGWREGVSGDLVGRTLLLLQLHPEIIAQVDVLASQRPKGLTVAMLRGLARVRDPDAQLRRFDRLLVELAVQSA